MNAQKGFIEDMESVFDNAEEALRRISGTRVCVSAGNDENFCADVKNNTAEFTGQMARKPTIRKRRYSGTVSSDANGWQKDETNKEMVKRCKLTAKDEVDNKTTANGKNKNNEISSPQPILKPQTQQQRLWRPFPL
uniref:Runt domain-containing protein n=1 Tax=Meloidogyne javanica TaxID=6303 RepID=A0A915M5U3_MELJA